MVINITNFTHIANQTKVTLFSYLSLLIYRDFSIVNANKVDEVVSWLALKLQELQVCVHSHDLSSSCFPCSFIYYITTICL